MGGHPRPLEVAAGKTVYAYVQRPGEVGGQREAFWAAHEKITVRRRTDAASKPRPEPYRAASTEALQAEIRRLRGEVLGLQDEKRALEERLSHLMQELEKTRKKIPKGISTS